MDLPSVRRAILPMALLFLSFLYVYSCVPVAIADLRILDARLVPASALPSPMDGLRQGLMRRGERLWKLSLEGDARWVGEIRRFELNTYPIVVRCDRPDYSLFAVGPYTGRAMLGDDARPGRSYTYDIFVAESGRYRSEADFNAPMPAYDLGKERIELCIRIAGGSMYGAYNQSNQVRIKLGRGK
jgi:hypothetical protein